MTLYPFFFTIDKHESKELNIRFILFQIMNNALLIREHLANSTNILYFLLSVNAIT